PLHTQTHPLSLHDALPISRHGRDVGDESAVAFLAALQRQRGLIALVDDTDEVRRARHQLRLLGSGRPGGSLVERERRDGLAAAVDRKSTRLNSSHVSISYA